MDADKLKVDYSIFCFAVKEIERRATWGAVISSGVDVYVCSVYCLWQISAPRFI